MTAARTSEDALALELIRQAQAALPCAYAPYSGFQVACTVIDDRGQYHSGVNVENASYGLTICAERVAIFAAIARGATRITAIALTSSGHLELPPCGACRQVMTEFCDAKTPVYADAGAARYVQWTVGQLLPAAFTKATLLDDPEAAASS